MYIARFNAKSYDIISLHAITAVDCPALPTPNDGGVTMTGITAGSVATYFCDFGFMLSDNTPRTCQPDGTWDGMEPTCDRSELVVHILLCFV